MYTMTKTRKSNIHNPNNKTRIKTRISKSKNSKTISGRKLEEVKKRIVHCKLCGAVGVNMRTCPKNRKAIHPRPDKHR
jgi:hypothetical protein